jgi:hypothetical protein
MQVQIEDYLEMLLEGGDLGQSYVRKYYVNQTEGFMEVAYVCMRQDDWTGTTMGLGMKVCRNH